MKQESERKIITFSDSDLQPESTSDTRQSQLLNFISWITQGYGGDLDPVATKKKLRMAFVVTLTLGALLILANAGMGIGNVFLCTLLMLAYLGYGKRLATSPAKRAIFADSIYYLGFLLTFVALLAGMRNIETTEPAAIIGSMGSAIATTIIGMAIRVYITQFDAITAEPETEVLTGIGELSSNLSSAIQSLNRAIDANIQSATSLYEKNIGLSEKLNKHISGIDFGSAVNALDTLSTSIVNADSQIKALEGNAKKIGDHFDSISSHVARSESALEAGTEAFEKLTTLVSNIDDTGKVIAKLSKGVDEKTDTLKQLNIGGLQEKFSEIEAQLMSAESDINHFRAIATRGADKLNETTGKVEASATDVALLRAELARLNEVTDQLKQAHDAIGSLKTQADSIKESIVREHGKTQEQFREIMATSFQETSNSMDSLQTSVGNARQNFEAVKTQLDTLGTQVKTTIAEVIKYIRKSE